MTLKEEFEQYVRACYGEKLDPASEQWAQVGFAFFAGAAASISVPDPQLKADLVEFVEWDRAKGRLTVH